MAKKQQKLQEWEHYHNYHRPHAAVDGVRRPYKSDFGVPNE
jgi:hypothetical protein